MRANERIMAEQNKKRSTFMIEHPLRHLPSIKEIQDAPEFKALEMEMDVFFLTELVKRLVNDLRKNLLEGVVPSQNLSKSLVKADILKSLKEEVERLSHPSPRRVINGTGVVLHTNLGRARLGEKVAAAVTEVAKNYSTLEFDLETGERGSRHSDVERLLSLITGAEAAMVVNNNAAAVYLILRALGKGKEVIVSRGELVEIGGSFRISSIMEESDTKLVEVGTTNKTHLYDYENALTDNTAILLKVHKSNFAITGFTEEVGGADLSKLAKKHGLIYYEDLGSGAVFNYATNGVGTDPAITYELTKETDLLSASGDKLFGGPQAGIILGKKVWIDQLKKHQLARVLRVDKMTLSAMNETLKAYLNSKTLKENIPTISDICEEPERIKWRALRFIERLEATHFECHCERTTSRVGGGTLPTVELKSLAVTLQHEKYTPQQLSRKLRRHKVPIISYLQHEKVWLDLRTISETEVEEIIKALKALD
jgi:L-seryl-tRNA(Ser) seleniumtransferase